jgi:hypothetical protein
LTRLADIHFLGDEFICKVENEHTVKLFGLWFCLLKDNEELWINGATA